MEKEKLIDWKTAIRRVPADQLDQVLAPVFDRKAVKAAKCIAKGLPAGPGAASGKIYLNADRAAAAAAKGEKVLLVRNETTPEDLRGMIAAEGILTAKGGVSSHAALVARQMGKVCVCGAGALQIDYNTRTMAVNGDKFNEGDFLSISGTAGEVYPGELRTAASEIVQVLVEKSLEGKESATYQMFKKLMDWCAKVTRLQVRANADQPEQAANAIAFGATGIGLCRTEHMFFGGNRIDAMREMILADNLEDRKKALAKLLPYQRDDFVGIFTRIEGPAGDHPHARPAVARIPAARRRGAAGSGEENGRAGGEDQTTGQGTARVQPDAGLARLPARHCLSGNHRDAGARHHRSRRPGPKRRHPGQAGNHDCAGGFPEGTPELSSKWSIALPNKCRPRKRPRSNTRSAR